MKKTILFLGILLSAFAMQAQDLRAVFDYSVYNTSKNNPYIETYISFDGTSLNFIKQKDGKYVASVDILLIFKRNDSIVKFTKRQLNSPIIDSPNENKISFLDVQRIALDNGTYEMEMTLKDNSKPDSMAVKVLEKDISVDFQKGKLQISNIQLVQNYTPTEKENILSKHGYDITPSLDYLVPKEMPILMYYSEIYNADAHYKEDQPYIAYLYLQDYLSGKKILDYQWQRVLKAKKLNVIFSSLNIRELPSGNYYLVLELRDTTDKILANNKVFFQRNNPAYDHLKVENKSFASIITSDSLLTIYIKSLDPIASPAEQHYIRNLSEKATLQEKQDFLDGFFIARYPDNAEEEWDKYYKRIAYVQANFGTRRFPGYKTDRGITYLKYGPPNYIIDEKFKASDGLRSDGKGYLPYQMWRYDMLEGDSKRMFVFWQEQFTGADYRLLHSNAKGEVADPFWENRLSRGTISEGEVGEAGRQFERGY